LTQSTLTSAVLAGVAAGVAIATKVSGPGFFSPGGVGPLAGHNWEREGEGARALASKQFYLLLATAALVGSTVIWASHGFHVGRLSELPPIPTRGRGVDTDRK